VGVPLKPGFDLVPIGKAETLRGGSSIAVLALGEMVTAALEAAEELAKEEIPVPR